MAAYSISRLHLPTIQLNLRRPNSSSSSSSLSIASLTSPSSFLGTLAFSLVHPPLITRIISSPNRAPVSATISFSLPTANPERATCEKVPKWSWRAIKSFAMGELEARKLKYPTTGTEALLMGILIEGTSIASQFLRANGITLTKVREESVNMLGKGDLYFFSPEHPPLTESAQKAIDWAMDQKLKSGENGVITTSDLLLGIWSEEESAGHKILAALGFDDEKAPNACLNPLSSKPGFNEA